MLRKRLKDQFSNRLFVPLAVVVLTILVGWILEYRHRQIDIMEYLGLAEYVGRPILDILLAMDPRKSIEIQVDTFLLIVKLLPTAVFNSSPVIIVLIVIPWLASHFIHALYDTKDVKEAWRFLKRNTLGMRALAPLMIVKEGHVFVGAGSLYDRVGGRGLLIVYNDSAVVIERGGRVVSVKGPSISFLKPFERIWGIVDLRPQRWPLTVNAMSKEGIPISCEAIITFKIDDRFIDGGGNVQTKLPVEIKTQLASNEELDKEIAQELEQAGIGEPFPYIEEAVFNAATSIWMRIQQPDHKEQLRRWTGRVIIGGTEGTLRNILANYRLDWLLQSPQPGQEHPREEVRRQLEEKLLGSFSVSNDVGAKILRVELGEIAVRDAKDKDGKPFGVPDKVYTQWLRAWQAGWEQRAVESQAEGEAELARLQIAQVQAQAEMILTLTEAIRSLVTDAGELSSYTLATRFVETLWWMSYSPWVRSFLPPKAIKARKELEKTLNADALPSPSR